MLLRLDQNVLKVMDRVYFVTSTRNELKSHSLPGFFSNASHIQLDAVQGSYSLAFRGDSGDRVWVGTIIGINYGEGFDLQYGHPPPDRLRLTACGCKVVGTAYEPLPWGLRTEILPKVGKADTPPRIRFFDGKIWDSLRRGGRSFPLFPSL